MQIVEMRELVRSLAGEHTVILSSHILSEISETCDRIFVIGDGKIIADGNGIGARRSLAFRDASRSDRAASGRRGSPQFWESVRGLTGVIEVTSREPREQGSNLMTFELQMQSGRTRGRDRVSRTARVRRASDHEQPSRSRERVSSAFGTRQRSGCAWGRCRQPK